MSSDIPAEKKFQILTQISRASHFAWRAAVVKTCPDVDPVTVVNAMWDITGVETGQAYLKRLDPAGDVAKQFADSIVWSSQCMGEDAHVTSGEPGEYLVRHDGCPWHVWHTRLGLSAEDRPGCDQWFDAAIRTINAQLGTELRYETLSALPDGDNCCLRRIWEEKSS